MCRTSLIVMLAIALAFTLIALAIYYNKYRKTHNKMYSKKTQSALRRFATQRSQSC